MTSAAPHVHRASERNGALLLFKRAAPLAEMGIRSMPLGHTRLGFADDELWYCTRGNAVFHRDNGEVIDVEPGVAVHFKQEWTGTVDVGETLSVSYMRCEGGAADVTPVLRQALTAAPLTEWGPISATSYAAGILLSREPDRRAESGIWTCTPGTWDCNVSSDEFCHFIAGRCTYTHESGERIDIEPDTLACFPAGWIGVCEVHETVRKVYMIR